MGSLKGKKVLITGGANGIGLCLARLMAGEGAVLVLVDKDAGGLETARAELAPRTGVFIHPVDISRRDRVEEAAARVLKETGGVDILINNAGIAHMGEMVETPLSDWERLMGVNFWGPLYLINAFMPSFLEKKGGQIVNVSSGQAFFRLPTWGPYSVSKLCFGAYSELLGLEARKLGIRVTTVYPYIVNTEGFHGGLSYETFGARLSKRLLPLYSQSPEKVAGLIFRAVKKKKPVEMISIANTFGFYLRLVPPAFRVMSGVAFRFLGKDPDLLREKLLMAGQGEGA